VTATTQTTATNNQYNEDDGPCTCTYTTQLGPGAVPLKAAEGLKGSALVKDSALAAMTVLEAGGLAGDG
jgi:hypothetical protein